MVSMEMSNEGLANSPLRSEANPINQEASSEHNENSEVQVEVLNNLVSNEEKMVRGLRKKKKNKNQKGKGKNKKIKNHNINNNNKDMNEDARREIEDKCILEYVGNSVTNDLIELFIDEVADVEELALQKTLLAREICKLDITKDMAQYPIDADAEKMDNLGIAKTDENCSPLDYASDLKKRGRKSIFELLTRARSVVGQTKITNLFEAGKGKNLPTGL